MVHLDKHYTDPDLVALYDVDSGWSTDRDFYLNLPSRLPSRVLDVGCGTGLIAARMAEIGHTVCGLDPAKAMLEIARNRPFGSKVDWRQGTIASAPMGPYDLIFMTGHAFQCLLTDQSIEDLFHGVAERLAENGSFVFETRNPRINWAKKWTGHRRLNIEGAFIHMEREILAQTDDQIRFVTRYKLSSGIKESLSTLRFVNPEKVDQLLKKCALRVNSLIGDWDSSPFNEETSEEMIFTVTQT